MKLKKLLATQACDLEDKPPVKTEDTVVIVDADISMWLSNCLEMIDLFYNQNIYRLCTRNTYTVVPSISGLKSTLLVSKEVTLNLAIKPFQHLSIYVRLTKFI